MRVVRGYRYDHLLVVDGKAYEIEAIADAVDSELAKAGVTNFGFHRPPFFKTGSPFADIILSICDQYSIRSVPVPKDMDCACVPHDGMHTYGENRPVWPEVFGASWDLEYPHGQFSYQKRDRLFAKLNPTKTSVVEASQ